MIAIPIDKRKWNYYSRNGQQKSVAEKKNIYTWVQNTKLDIIRQSPRKHRHLIWFRQCNKTTVQQHLKVQRQKPLSVLSWFPINFLSIYSCLERKPVGTFIHFTWTPKRSSMTYWKPIHVFNFHSCTWNKIENPYLGKMQQFCSFKVLLGRKKTLSI